MKITRTPQPPSKPETKHQTVKHKGFAAHVTKLFRTCLPIPTFSKFAKKAPTTTWENHAEIGKSVGLSPSTQAPAPKKTPENINDTTKAIAEELRREIAEAHQAQGEIAALAPIIEHFTAPKTSIWGHQNPEKIAQWVEELAETNQDAAPQFSAEKSVDTWIAQQLSKQIQEKKAAIRAHQGSWHAVREDHEFKQELLNTLLQGSSDSELEDEDFEPYLLSAIETLLSQAEHHDLSLQLDTGETVTLPGAYIKTKPATWLTHGLPEQITELKTLLSNAVGTIKHENKNIDWEDVLKDHPQSRLENAFTQETSPELALHCPELLRSLIHQALDAPENYAAYFTTREGLTLAESGELPKKQGKAWRTKTFPQQAQELEKKIDSKIEKFSKLFTEHSDSDLWSFQLNHVLERVVKRSAIHLPALGSEFSKQLIETKLASQQASILSTKPHQVFNKFEYVSRHGTKLTIEDGNPDVAKTIEDAIYAEVLQLQKEQFMKGAPWNKNKAAQLVLDALQNLHPFVLEDINFSTTLILEALTQGTGHYKHFLEKTQTNNTHTMQGGYFKKKNIFTNHTLLKHSMVMGARGHVYELLNTLNTEDSHELMSQHQQNRQGQTVIGRGTFGKVRFARNIDTGEIVAVKKIRSKEVPGESSSRQSIEDSRVLTKQETEPMLMIEERITALNVSEEEKQQVRLLFSTFEDHAHIPSLRLNRIDHRGNTSTETAHKSYIFSPYANLGDGERAMSDLSVLKKTDPDAANALLLHIAKNYTRAITWLHHLNIHHRDIKPENFLHSHVKQAVTLDDGSTTIRAVEQIKLTDFGFAKSGEEAGNWHGETPGTSPPETYETRLSKYHAETHDNFSLGMTLLAIKLGEYPSPNQVHHLTLKNRQGNASPLKLDFYDHERCKGIYSFRLRNLDMTHIDNIIAKLIARAPADRISAAEALTYLEALDPNQDHLA